MAEQPAIESPESISEKRRVPLNELALFSLRLGTTAFGGPAAHIAIMEDELVRRRQWLSREKFLDLLGAKQSHPWAQFKRIGYSYRLLVRRLERSADRW
jgi:hypothetical protein